jgi:single-strand DNA-binding protein
MASVNRVTIIGNLCADPELRYNPAGVAFCTLSIATNRSWKDKASGEKREEVEFHRVVFNDKLAEIVGQYCKKGRPLYVEGRLRTRKWQDKEGKDVYTAEIIASEMQLLGGRDSGEEGESAPAPAPRRAAPAPGPVPLPGRYTRPGSAAGHGSVGDSYEQDIDSIPF